MTTPLNNPAPIFTPTQLDDDGEMFSIHLSIQSCEPAIHCGWVEFNNEFQTWGITRMHNISDILDRDYPTYEEANEALISSLEPVLHTLIKMIIERDCLVKSKRDVLTLEHVEDLKKDGVIFKKAYMYEKNLPNARSIETKVGLMTVVKKFLLAKNGEPYVL